MRDRHVVALYDNYLSCMAGLSREDTRRLTRFTSRFRRDPIGQYVYEKIDGATGPNMRILQVDEQTQGAYWAVVLRPEKRSRQAVFVLLWAAPREDAEAWARGHNCSIHPVTGALQIVPVEVERKAAAAAATAPLEDGAYAQFSDDQLMGLGVPTGALGLVRQLRDEAHLDEHGADLPQEAYEGLALLARGESLETTRRALGFEEPHREVDPEDYSAALLKPTSRQRFMLVDDDEELEAILSAPLERWRVFLHASQRRLVERKTNGAWRVLGGAGTGKTVVLMHRARHLAAKVFNNPNDRVLVTTFTTNLAADIKASLEKICSPEVMERIEVASLDRWVSHFLKRQGFGRRLCYYREREGVELYSLWREAMDNYRPDDLPFPDSFYREEWEEVVQFHGCETEREYLRASRKGRGVRLNRADRRAVWSVFAEYRQLMKDNDVCESADAMRAARRLLEGSGQILPYRSVLVDEAQDIGQEAFRLLRQMVPLGEDGKRQDDLFIVGDGHQKIYRRRVVLSHAGIHVRGRARRLRVNYRTTEQIRRFAVGVLEGGVFEDLDGGDDQRRGYKSLVRGVAPVVKGCQSFEEELDEVMRFVGDDPAQHHQTCLVVRTRKLLERMEAELKARGVQTLRLQRSKAEDRSKPGLRLATMHRVKGLEFEKIAVANVNKRVVPLDAVLATTSDDVVRLGAESGERALLYVSLTRARREALVTYHGEPSPFLGLEHS